MAKLSAIAASRKATELEFTGINFIFTEKGEKIAILQLKNALEKVNGSQSISDEDTGEQVRVSAWDVTEIKVNPKSMDDDGFDVDENTLAGTYKGDLRLDVAKRTGEVWLVSETFNSMGRQMRSDNQKKRQGSLVANLLARNGVGSANKIANTGAGAPVGSNKEKVDENIGG